jgi:two-component system, sensor histidine kinase and response regulator
MRVFAPAIPDDKRIGDSSFDLKPALADDEWAVLLVRVGIVVILLSQPLFFVSELRFGGAGEASRLPLTGFHLFNFIAASIGLAFSGTQRFRVHWRAAAFTICTMLMVSSLVTSIGAGGRHEALYLSLQQIVLGAAMLVPWEARWQLKLGLLSVLALGANTIFASHVDPNFFYHWLGLITAAGLAQAATGFGVRYRERTQQYQRLREREFQLSESEEKFRRVFETSSDVIVITRVDDGTILEVNREFVERTGYSHDEVVGRKPSELELWEDKDQLKLLSETLKSAGFMRNVEGRFRLRSGELVTALISSVKATINGRECVISAVRDVTELREAHEALVAAREAALAASEAKSQFLSCMSHEIRTPLNVILGSADLLSDAKLGPEQRHYIDRIVNNGATLLDLLNSILDLTRVESGQLNLEQVPFNPGELTERVTDTLAIRAHERQVELVVRVAPGVPATLLGDPLRLNQVLTNLIGNALKFTDQGEIVVAVELESQSREPGMLRFSVRDTGIGIHQEKLSTIFSPFAQADSSTTRKYGGSGLGLAIVDRLVRLMDGRVWVESEVGKGSAFYFTARFEVPQGAAPAAPFRADLHDVRALVVDDNAACRLAAREALETSGVIVVEAGSAAAAVEASERACRVGQAFDLAFVDCSDASGAGFEIAGRVAAASTSAPPLIIAMLSSHGLSASFARLREAGLEQYVVKPLKRTDLLGMAARTAKTPVRSEPPSAPIAQTALPASADQTVASARHAAGAIESAAMQPVKPRCRILVADDSVDNRLLIRAYLGKTGFALDEAENGQVAIDKLAAGRYDLVLMDIQMPVMDGFAAVRRIRELEREKGMRHTPIIALTASAFDETVRKAVEAGCDSHLGKPLKRSTLLRVINESAFGVVPGEQAASAAA